MQANVEQCTANKNLKIYVSLKREQTVGEMFLLLTKLTRDIMRRNV